jgi:hypothetical protein
MTTLADLEIGNPKTVLNLTAVPLSGNPASTLDYLLIDEALETKKVIVEEVSEGGSVPELRSSSTGSSRGSSCSTGRRRSERRCTTGRT